MSYLLFYFQTRRAADHVTVVTATCADVLNLQFAVINVDAKYFVCLATICTIGTLKGDFTYEKLWTLFLQ